MVKGGLLMSDMLVLAFCVVFGFASAGAISSFYKWVTSQNADFSFPEASFRAAAVTILVNMFAGPFILTRKVIEGVRTKEVRAIPAVVGGVIAGMWSAVAGIFYISLLLTS
jgi:hypothetical protein